MDIADGIRTMMAAVQSENSGMSVAVVSAGVSGTGMKSSGSDSASLEVIGENGQRTQTVRISAATFVAPERNATILVAGSPVKVVSVDLDAVGALYVVRYIETQPVG